MFVFVLFMLLELSYYDFAIRDPRRHKVGEPPFVSWDAIPQEQKPALSPSSEILDGIKNGVRGDRNSLRRNADPATLAPVGRAVDPRAKNLDCSGLKISTRAGSCSCGVDAALP